MIHTQDDKPIHVTTRELAMPERKGDKGWALAKSLDLNKAATLPELIAGKAKGRQSAREVTCFLNNLGLGYQFAAAGAVVYRKAKENGLGHELPNDWFTQDVHP